MALIVILSAAGYILVAEAPTVAVAIAGVVCTALSSGLGEASLLSYMAFYKNKHIISTWSSGTGAAGFFGSFTYAILTKILGSHKITLYVLLTVPAVMGMSFWFLLEPPKRSDGNSNGSNKGNGTTGDLSKVSSSRSSEIDSEVAPIIGKSTSLSYKFSLIPSLFKYMIPLFLVYLFEYFINQGLFELITFDISWLTHAEQYKWYQVDYQYYVRKKKLHAWDSCSGKESLPHPLFVKEIDVNSTGRFSETEGRFSVYLGVTIHFERMAHKRQHSNQNSLQERARQFRNYLLEILTN
uniref:Battenin n=1 Tax=Rhodnius prolixus TaxID=13249 RepID=T1HNT8_RHOPR